MPVIWQFLQFNFAKIRAGFSSCSGTMMILAVLPKAKYRCFANDAVFLNLLVAKARGAAAFFW
jgi:hypothetical protein